MTIPRNLFGHSKCRLAFILCLLALSACQEEPQSNLPTTRVKIGDSTFTLEIANRDDSRMNGLMRRDSMPEYHGMIFVFEFPAPRQFWMKNTRIPLDILFLDQNARVITIKHMQPYVTDPPTTSDGSAKYAIELNDGMAQRVGVKVGDTIDIPQEARDVPRQ